MDRNKIYSINRGFPSFFASVYVASCEERSKNQVDIPFFSLLQLLVKKVMAVWEDLEDALFVIEPEVLYKIVEQENYSDNEGRCAIFCHLTKRAIAFGVFGHKVAMVNSICLSIFTCVCCQGNFYCLSLHVYVAMVIFIVYFYMCMLKS